MVYRGSISYITVDIATLTFDLESYLKIFKLEVLWLNSFTADPVKALHFAMLV